MKFQELLDLVGDEPLFTSSILLTGDVDPADVRRQLSRWTKAGLIWQLRRGLYTLAPPYQKVEPHPFVVANHLTRGSYVSLESALAYYGLIPEYVAVTTSVGNVRPHTWRTPLGVFMVRHIKPDLLFGYDYILVAPRQRAFVATPEKALLDLLYLQPNSDDPSYIQELRLQNLDRIDTTRLTSFAERARSPKLRRAIQHIIELAKLEQALYEVL